MSANLKASVDGTQAIIGVGGVDQMTVSNAGVVTANSFVGNVTGNLTGNVTGGTLSGNASSATAIATGSTTARTLANRFADVVNVKDFGAVGDGVADDTTAIQLSINKAQIAGGGIVFFPQGQYKITTTIVINNPTYGVTLQGSGNQFASSIFSTVNTGPLIEIQSSQVQIKDLSIYRNVFCNTGTGAYNLYFNGAVQCLVENCRIQGGTNAVLVANNSFDNIFLRNTFTFCTGSSIFDIQESGAIHCIACTFNQQYPSATIPTSSSYAGSWTASTSFALGKIILVGSYFFRCVTAGTTGSSIPSDLTTPTKWYLQNITDGSAEWQLMCRSDYSGIRFNSKTEYCTIRQCDFTGPFLNAITISNQLALGLPTGINIENCTAHGPILNGLSVNGREIYVNDLNTWNPTSGDGSVIGFDSNGIIVLSDAYSLQIIGSQCYGFKYGLRIANISSPSGASQVIATSNNFTNSVVGIRVENNIKNFALEANNVGLGPRGGNTNGIQVGGSGCSNYIITNNIISGATTGISDLGVAPKTVTGNI